MVLELLLQTRSANALTLSYRSSFQSPAIATGSNGDHPVFITSVGALLRTGEKDGLSLQLGIARNVSLPLFERLPLREWKELTTAEKCDLKATYECWLSGPIC